MSRDRFLCLLTGGWAEYWNLPQCGGANCGLPRPQQVLRTSGTSTVLVVSCLLVQRDASNVMQIATMTHSHTHPKSLLTTGHRCSCRRRSGFHLPRIQASVGWVQAPILHLRNRGQEDNQNRKVWRPLEDVRGFLR